MRFETKALHVGRKTDPSTGAVTVPLHLSTTYERSSDGTYTDGYLYSRADNPNRRSFEACLTSLEEGHDCVTYASGMAAIASVIEALPEDKPRRIVLPDDIYFAIHALISSTDIGSKFEFVITDMTNLSEVEEKVKSAPTGLVWMETPSNPNVKVTDIEAVVKIAKEAGAYTVVDNTWPTPVLQKPLFAGADFSLHSVTKYIGGHSDLMIGAVIVKSDDEYLQRLRAWQQNKGAVPSPFDCWLALRGVQSISARMRVHCGNAQYLAEFLDAHPNVEAVHYPGLKSHAGHDIAKKQMTDFGGMLSFQVKGDREDAMKAVNKLNLFTQATSLGGTHSYIEHRASVEGENTTAPDNLLRVSVGIENVEDLKEDLAQALG